jgi:hypothetical protein
MGASLTDLASFSKEAKRAAGFEWWQVQVGAMPSDFKSMPTVGAGASEGRMRGV